MAGRRRDWLMVRRMWHSGGERDQSRPAALFDFDSTLAPYRRRGPPADVTLRFLVRLSRTFDLAIVSNRSNAGEAALKPLREYVDALDAALGCMKVCVYAPTAQDRDRKPCTGSWDHYVSEICGGRRPWYAFYCGDAAGRQGDHSSADYAFALNTGMRFVAVESVFQTGPPFAAPESLGCAAPVPGEILRGGVWPQLQRPGPRTVVVLVGSPGCGKTTLAARVPGVAVLSRDVLGDLRCPVSAALAKGEAFIVDSTSPTTADRAWVVAAAKEAGFSAEVWHLTAEKSSCFHLNGARRQLGGASVPPVAIHTYWTRLQPPTEQEARELGYTLRAIPHVTDPEAPEEVTGFRYA
jgi:bifunctional polynucleotide phosphatase/kinase